MHLKFLYGKIVVGQFLGSNGVLFPAFGKLQVQGLIVSPQLLIPHFQISILLIFFLELIILMFDFPEVLVGPELDFSLKFTHFLFVLDLQELELVIFFLVELRDGFLLEVHFLDILVLVVGFLVQELLNFISE